MLYSMVFEPARLRLKCSDEASFLMEYRTPCAVPGIPGNPTSSLTDTNIFMPPYERNGWARSPPAQHQ